MKRALLTLSSLVVILLAAAAIYVLRAGGAEGPAQPMDGAPQAAASPPTGAIPRGDVSIDPRRQQLTGVRTAPVVRESIRRDVRTVGLIRYDETTLVDVNLRLDGWIRDLYVDYTGQSVERGEPLFTLYSPDLLATEQEYLLALKARDEMRSSVLPEARDRADQLVASARRRLALWDLPADELRRIEETRQASEAVRFVSPAAGFVVDKAATRGMHVTPGQTLYKIANVSTVWIDADVYEQEMDLARVGQRATVSLDAYPGRSFEGRAIYVYPVVDEQSRTIKVRFEFANADGRLKPGMFANVEIHGRDGIGTTVPANAVIDSGTDSIVFVAQGDGYFSPRTVKVGRRLGERTEILEGVREGEEVATGATFFLDSESQLRAGLDNYAPVPGASSAPGAAPLALDIAFLTDPDPPKTGESRFEVTLKDAGGQPVTDADVAVQLFMPAMPAMNMPAMRSETKLTHAGSGVYRGVGQVMMAGHWDVTVVVSKGGRQIGRKQLALAAR